ncbi:DUF4919 domain-containing protein [uncultured Stenotrophomonas sp.]|uniref:DUF4919 domain-containing protein n=1 Tax=uncultured Stenotrophomonas sp. TaxID=165438 RepID=UPI0025D6607E|nr:DUF4919 domain-containing protein [uncultured Stenotrophomonas sp.]
MTGIRLRHLSGFCAAIALAAVALPALAIGQQPASMPAAPAPPPTHPDESAARQTAQRYQQLLPLYRWRLLTAVDKDGMPRAWFGEGADAPQLQFGVEDKSPSAEPSLLLHSELCKRQVDGEVVLRRYQVQGADPQREVAWQLNLRRLPHERTPALTCQKPAYTAELRLLQMLSGGHALRMRVEPAKKDRPQLELGDAFGGVLRFEGTALVQGARYGLQGAERLLQIKEASAACANSWLPGNRCLLFREVALDGRGNAASDWNGDVLAVDGYKHSAGTDVMLLVRRYGSTGDDLAAPMSYRAERQLWERGATAGPEMMASVAGVRADAVLEPEQATFYPKLLARFIGRDRGLAGTEFAHLYYGAWLQRNLGPKPAEGTSPFKGADELAAVEGYLELRRKVAASDEAGGSAGARLQLYQDFLGRYPLHLNALESLAGDDAAVRFGFDGLLQAIMASGDGNSCQSPWIVTSSADIGVVFRHLALDRDYAMDRKEGEACLRVGSGEDGKYFLVLGSQ